MDDDLTDNAMSIDNTLVDLLNEGLIAVKRDRDGNPVLRDGSVVYVATSFASQDGPLDEPDSRR